MLLPGNIIYHVAGMGAQAGKQAAGGPEQTAVLASAVQPVAGRPGEYDVLVSVKPPEGKARVPLDICCVVDISGSMCVEATLKNAQSGAQEGHGLSVLDVVRHAVGTVVASLQPGDRLSVVTFNLQAKVVFELSNMDEAGKKRVAKVLESLDADAATNIWAGLEAAVKHLKSKASADRYAAILLLTDGQPNEGPKEGEVAALRQLKAQNEKALSGLTISTFGFGYDINSELLRDLAIEGGGVYSFLPDSSFVGTTFVNSLANLLVTVARDVRVNLEPKNGAKLSADFAAPAHLTQQTPTGGVTVSLCSMQLGQSKDFVVRLTIPDSCNGPFLSVKVTDDHGRTLLLDVTDKSAASPEVEAQRQRLAFITGVHEALAIMQRKEPLAKAQAHVASVLAQLNASPAAKEKRVADLITDMSGQVTEAFSRDDWYTKWGRHYLPSLLRAHLVQQCNNFKDPGVQHYGGQVFRSLRDQIDEIFLKLPAPKRVVHDIPGVHQVSQPSVNMRVYHNSSAPCFAGSSMVLMADGSLQRVDSLRKGMRVAVPNSDAAEVVCVIKTRCPDETAELVCLPGGLLITPYHPVRIDGKWHFPCDLKKPQLRVCSAVYSFVLSAGHVMIINGTECVSMGHGFNEDVVRHPYFGSAAIIADLARLPGWNAGCVEFSRGGMIRDPETKLVNRLVYC